MNFVHTLPFVAVCIGLALNKRPVLGVVYCPALDQMFTGRQGNGAYCNGQPISVRCSSALRDSLVCAEFGSDRDEEKRHCVMKNLESVSWQCHGIRCLGSAAMNICSVAMGQTNAFYEFGLHCWDMCAPVAILVEAGGYACDTKGGPLNLIGRRLIVACNDNIARQLSAAMPCHLELPSD